MKTVRICALAALVAAGALVACRSQKPVASPDNHAGSGHAIAPANGGTGGQGYGGMGYGGKR